MAIGVFASDIGQRKQRHVPARGGHARRAVPGEPLRFALGVLQQVSAQGGSQCSGGFETEHWSFQFRQNEHLRIEDRRGDR